MYVIACWLASTSCTCGVAPKSTSDMRDSPVVTDDGSVDVNTAWLCVPICFSSHDGVSDDCRSSWTMRLWSVMGRILRKPSPFEPMINGMEVPVLVWNCRAMPGHHSSRDLRMLTSRASDMMFATPLGVW